MTSLVLIICLACLLLSGSLTALFGKWLGGKSHRIGVASMLLVFLGSIWILLSVTTAGPVYYQLPVCFEAGPDWLRIDFYVDRLSAIMMVLISTVSAVIHVFSISYMQGDPGYSRFFSRLGLITFALLAMVTSGSLFMLLFWWQLVSWLLYLLLSHNYENGAAIRSAFKTLVILRFGDVALLCGAILTYKCYGTLQFPVLFERVAAHVQTVPLWTGGPEINSITAITLLFFVGAMAKSAQLPLNVWLPDTMDAPTPVSALMHAGLVNAGGFLINRLAPLYGLSTDTLHIVFGIGFLTALVGTTIMLTRTDVKTMLGFSTMGQMGFMIMECGLGAFSLAIFHLIAHGIFKATLFLSAGSVIHKARKEPHFPTPRKETEPEVFKRLPWTTGVFMTLLLPLVILVVANEVVEVHLSQGTIILLFFAWVTSSQAILSLYSLRTMESWKVATAMVLTVSFIVLTYVWATETFTYFLYPTAGEASGYFSAAAFPVWMFDSLIGVILLLLLSGWYLNIIDRHKAESLIPRWTIGFSPVLYMWLWNRLYVDQLYLIFGRSILNTCRRLDAALPDWLP
ncbi:MAG: proton-conducting transporter membrane subunit [Candidatus Melainabacteria bacterium]|nr:proton-conducting transporter membrane subunit [Candidatus Melainabacteria bacterium]